MARTADLGRISVEVHTGSTGYPVRPPKWSDDNEARVIDGPESIYLTRMSNIGWVLRLGDKPLVSINEGDLESLGLALIRASAR